MAKLALDGRHYYYQNTLCEQSLRAFIEGKEEFDGVEILYYENHQTHEGLPFVQIPRNEQTLKSLKDFLSWGTRIIIFRLLDENDLESVKQRLEKEDPKQYLIVPPSEDRKFNRICIYKPLAIDIQKEYKYKVIKRIHEY